MRCCGLIQCFVRLLPSMPNRNTALTLKKTQQQRKLLVYTYNLLRAMSSTPNNGCLGQNPKSGMVDYLSTGKFEIFLDSSSELHLTAPLCRGGEKSWLLDSRRIFQVGYFFYNFSRNGSETHIDDRNRISATISSV